VAIGVMAASWASAGLTTPIVLCCLCCCHHCLVSLLPLLPLATLLLFCIIVAIFAIATVIAVLALIAVVTIVAIALFTPDSYICMICRYGPWFFFPDGLCFAEYNVLSD
jgi:hypothetical protein